MSEKVIRGRVNQRGIFYPKVIPADTITLIIRSQRLSTLPPLPEGLKKLDCEMNILTGLPPLPEGLVELDCAFNKIESLPPLPEGLKDLTCNFNKLSVLPELPNLNTLICTTNNLTSLPPLPEGLKILDCGSNPLQEFPQLPDSLEELKCIGISDVKRTTKLPPLPPSLRILQCNHNYLTILPKLPETLVELWCHNNNLKVLPRLPMGIRDIVLIDNPWEEPFATFIRDSGSNIAKLIESVNHYHDLKNAKRNMAAFNLTIGAPSIVDPDTGKIYNNPLPPQVTNHMRSFLGPTEGQTSSGYGYPKKTQNLILRELTSRPAGAPGVGRRRTRRRRSRRR